MPIRTLVSIFFVMMTNQIHKWAHTDDAPKVVVWLQRLHLILPPAHHEIHHTAPFNSYYSITTGWLNWPLDVLVADCRRLIEQEGYCGVQIKVDAFTVQPNFERELFVYRPLGDTADIYVNRIQTAMRALSHHFVLYAIDPAMTTNTRFQIVLVYTMPASAKEQAIRDVQDAVAAGALRVGAEAGLPLHRFPLERTADAHAAVEANAVGKVLIDIG